MSSLWRSLAVVLLLSSSAAGYAVAQGYDGLVAPEVESAPAANTTDDGYSGLLAPTTPAKTGRSAPEKQPGYSGVVAGDIDEPEDATVPVAKKPKDFAGKFTPGVPKQQMTKNPSALNPGRPQTSEALRASSTLYAIDKNNDGVPDAMVEKMKRRVQPTEAEKLALNTPRPRQEGMLLEERMIYNGIASSIVDVKTAPAATRADKQKQALDNLKVMRSGIVSKRSVPPSIYKALGMTDLYIREERESLEASLIRVDAAIDELETIQ